MAPTKSFVWKYFVREGDSAQCKLCCQKLKCCGNTSNMKTHLLRKHNIVPDQDATDDPDVDDPSPRVFSIASSRPRTANGIGGTASTSLGGHCEPSPSTSGRNLNDYFRNTHSPSPSSCRTTPTPPLQNQNPASPSLSISENSNEPITATPFKVRRPNQVSIDDAIKNMSSYKDGGKKCADITDAIVYMIVKDNEPFSIVEHTGFRKLLKTAVPLYRPPSRRTMTRLVDEKFHVYASMFKEQLKTAVNITLTTDAWTDPLNSKSYIGLTVHFISRPKLTMKCGTIGIQELDERHTSEYLADVLEKLLIEWNIDIDNVIAVVTDNGSNIVKAIHTLFGRNKHLPCFAHTLNLVPVKATENTPGLTELKQKIKGIVTYFKHNNNAADALRQVQLKNGKTDGTLLKLKQECETRWNSTFYMMERFLLLNEEVSSILLKFPKAPGVLNADELMVVKDVIALFRPMEQAMTELCGDKYVTSSKVITLVYLLLASMTKSAPATELGLLLKDNLLKEMEKRFGTIEKVHLLAISNMLDPRFKRMYFKNPAACANIVNTINNLVKEQNRTESVNTDTHAEDVSMTDADDLWSHHKEMVATYSASRSFEDNDGPGLCFELKQFLNSGLAGVKNDPLLDWGKLEIVYPRLSVIALKHLSVVATSVPCERLFSKAGNILTDKRNRLSGKRLSRLLFLNIPGRCCLALRV